MSYFNEDQQSWMRHLASLPPEKKCDCGWDLRGNCFGTCYGFPEKGGAVRNSVAASCAVKEEPKT